MKIFHTVYMFDIYLVANFFHDGWWHILKNINLSLQSKCDNNNKEDITYKKECATESIQKQIFEYIITVL